jgi:anti-sigma factor RsiW
MRCEQARERIGRLVDGELPAAERDALMTHAADCPECARYRDDLTRLRRHLQEVREPAPAKLATRLSAALAVEASEASLAPAGPTTRTREKLTDRLSAWILPHLPQAAALLLACLLSIAGTAWWMQRTSVEAALSRDVLAAHVRALIQDHPVQVASLDTHTIKPWFAGRLDYSPVVKDLSNEGFQLVGGRLDYVAGQRVAAVVYKRRLHQISVFVWPSGAHTAAPYAAKVDGFSLLGWSRGGMAYWAVSDLNEGELRELQGLL